MAVATTAAEGELPYPVSIFNPVDDAGLGKRVQSPVDRDSVHSGTGQLPGDFFLGHRVGAAHQYVKQRLPAGSML